jgi:hypothetical protein
MEPTFEGLIETLNINNCGRGYMTNEQYIEHEVKIRVHEERFGVHHERFCKLESKLNWIISLLVGGMILPVFLHFLKLI